ncbi:Cobalt transport protein CbiM [Sporomusa rhizae]|uniref:energy-coupling factor ABC transporter permease n=1 Tax=Sporomusa rhizae TaxID=357999 RepID=UPI00352AA230
MKIFQLLFCFLLMNIVAPAHVFAMHIMEGFLPKEYALGWLIVTLPFILYGSSKISKTIRDYPERKMLLGLAGAFIFVLSALKIPSITGSCSHPTGVGLSAILFGPSISTVLSGIVLVFQALLLAHGGITTWGANTFSMGIAGSFTAWILFTVSRKVGLSDKVAVFLAAAVGDWTTYMVTAGQLAMAFPDTTTGFIGSYLKFLGVFALTQIPLAVSEGFLSVIVYNMLQSYDKQGLISLWPHKEGDPKI